MTDKTENNDNVSKELEIFKSIMLNMQDGVIAVDNDGKIIASNPAAASILMLEDQELAAKEFKLIFEKFILEPENDDFNDTILNAIYSSEIIQHKATKFYSNKICKNLLVSASNLYINQDGNHTKIGVIIVMSDLTEMSRLTHMKNIFWKYVDPQIATKIIDFSEAELKAGNKQVITVSFCDMKNFTKLCESLPPSILEEIMNIFFSDMSDAVHKNNGVIDKFIGDSIMSFWGFPFTKKESQTIDACQTALDQIERLTDVNKAIHEIKSTTAIDLSNINIGIRIGMAMGESVIANIGSNERKSFTILGDITNLSARLVGVNKIYGTNILLTKEIMKLAKDAFEFREIDTICVKGKEGHNAIYELLGVKGSLSEEHIKFVKLYETALAQYRQQKWREATKLLNEALTIIENDQACIALLERINIFKKDPPPKSWRGIYYLENK